MILEWYTLVLYLYKAFYVYIFLFAHKCLTGRLSFRYRFYQGCFWSEISWTFQRLHCEILVQWKGQDQRHLAVWSSNERMSVRHSHCDILLFILSLFFFPYCLWLLIYQPFTAVDLLEMDLLLGTDLLSGKDLLLGIDPLLGTVLLFGTFLLLEAEWFCLVVL